MTHPHDPTDPQDPTGSEGPPEVGSVGEEAAKLLGALSGWAQESGGDTGAGLGAAVSGLAGLAAERFAEVGDHLATGAAECTWCPVCRTVHAVRGTSPEVRAHLASAASSLLQAVSGLLATIPPPATSGGAGSPRPPDGPLQRIDLDGDDGDGRDHDNHDDHDDNDNHHDDESDGRR